MSPPRQIAQPSTSSDRIVELDAIRGFALLGILVANINGFALGPDVAEWSAFWDKLASFAIDTIVRGKFIILFSVLFGISFSLQLERIDRIGTTFNRYFARRQLALLLIAVLHVVLLSEQDILVLYAVLGMALWAFRNVRSSVLLPLALIFFVGSFVPTQINRIQELTGTETTIDSDAATLMASPAPTHQSTTHPYASADFAKIVEYRIKRYLEVNPATYVLEYPRKFAMFLFGLYLVKSKRVQTLTAPDTNLFRLTVIAGVLGVTSQVLLFLCYLSSAPDWALLARLPLIAVANPSLSAFYALLLMMLLRSTWAKPLALTLAAPGKMALTNYILQSFICTTIFYGYGFSFYNTMGPLSLLLLAVLIYVFLSIFSSMWLRQYAQGPLEYAWKRFAYG